MSRKKQAPAVLVMNNPNGTSKRFPLNHQGRRHEAARLRKKEREWHRAAIKVMEDRIWQNIRSNAKHFTSKEEADEHYQKYDTMVKNVIELKRSFARLRPSKLMRYVAAHCGW